MKLPHKERLLWPTVTLGLAAILLVLAVLQYRWTGEVSKADEARMQASLQTSMVGMREDLYRELAGISEALRSAPQISSAELGAQYARQLADWSRTAAHPSLVAAVFLVEASGSQVHLTRLNRTSGRFEDAAWPEEFGELREWMQSTPVLQLSRTAPRHSRGPASLHDGARRFDAERPQPRGGPGFRFGEGPPQWLVDPHIPALIHPAFRIEQPGPERPDVETARWAVVQLSGQVLRDVILPDLTEKHFAGPDGLIYQLAVLEVGGRREVLYSSDPGFEKDASNAPDSRLNLFGLPEGVPGSRMNVFSLSGPPPAGPSRGVASRDDPPGNASPGMTPSPGTPPQQVIVGRDAYGRPARFEAMHYSPKDGDWQLIALHRNGSLEAAVAALRRRNLALSFGILLLLAVTMSLVIIAGARAHRLAGLQMEFVASVSHELRTPVAAISSAADNMADGLVESKDQVARYGTMIRGQARQLIQLVEQILLFASTRESHQRYAVKLVDPSEIVDAALSGTETLLNESGIHLERVIEPGLPQIAGDPAALSQCVQNLITNAVKYRGERHWIGVRASMAPGPRGSEVRIAVSDKGIGIHRREMRQIFEPFYRSPSVTVAQIHGTGLGLPLVKRMVEAMNGRVTVSSEAGKGSSFVLHLPAAAPLPVSGKMGSGAAAETPSWDSGI